MFVCGFAVAEPLAFTQDVPPAAQVKLILKIASMDRNFARFGDPVKIGVSSDTYLDAFKQGLGKLKIKGKDFVVEKMASLDDLGKYKLVYIDTNWKSNYGAVGTTASANKILVFTSDPDYVQSGAGGIAFKVVEGKAKIVLNLGNVKDQGTDFPSNFLKVTYVVGGLK